MSNPKTSENRSLMALMATIVGFGVVSAYFSLREPKLANSDTPPVVSESPAMEPGPSPAPVALPATEVFPVGLAPVQNTSALKVPPRPVASVLAPVQSTLALKAAPRPVASLLEPVKAASPKKLPAVKPAPLTSSDAYRGTKQAFGQVAPVTERPAEGALSRPEPLKTGSAAVTLTDSPAPGTVVSPILNGTAKASPHTEALRPAGPSETPAPSSGTTTHKDSESVGPVVKAATAPLLVPSKPVVLMTTKDKVWVKLDERRTVIVTKGDEVPGLGKLLDMDAKNVRFEKGSVPVTSE